jgi:low temperature requirement protein LtrA
VQSRWFHRPHIHVPNHHHPKKVGWLELFYDLIFVAGIIQLGDFLSEGTSLGDFGLFALHFAPLWIAWTGFTFYANRFSVDDVLHRFLVILNMFSVGAMAIASPAAMEGRPTAFALAYAASTVILGAMYLRTWRQVPAARDYSAYWGGVFVATGVLFALSTLVPLPYGYAFWALAMALILFAPMSKPAQALQARHPLDMEHLVERYGLLTIIVLGESFVKVLSYLTSSGLGEEASYQLKGFFNLGITCSLWWLYFDDVAGSEVKRGRIHFMAWLYGHLPLALGLTAVGVAVKKAIKVGLSDVPAPETRWLLAGSLALVFVSIALIDTATERPNVQVNERIRITSRWVAGITLLLVAQVGGSMTGGVFLGIVTAICAAQVIFDLMMAPLGITDAAHSGAVSIATAIEERRAGNQPSGWVRGATSSAVRLGAPPELRRDLYFFFLEGGWPRLLLSFGALYIALNIVFAGLFMLEPAGVGGAETVTFTEAFYLSVQTLGTIGYGVLHPKSEWANMVVTVEAAVGMLFAALATGTILAKAARPRSAVLFAKHAVITQHEGKRTLMMRVANARGNDVVEASVSVSVIKDTVSSEGHSMRKVMDLKLVRDRQPMFGLTWTVFHVIDETSPLADVSFDQNSAMLGLVMTLMGHDGTYGQTIYARNIYDVADIRPDHHYVDVMSQLPDGRLVIDLGRFHDTVPVPA